MFYSSSYCFKMHLSLMKFNLPKNYSRKKIQARKYGGNLAKTP